MQKINMAAELSRRSVLALSTFGAAALRTKQVFAAADMLKIVVGFPAGGGTDIVARALAEQLRKTTGRTVIVENRPGAGSNIASDVVARAAPDGNTVLLGGNFSHAINPHLYAHLTFDARKDFTPLTRVNYGPFLFAVRTDSPIQSFPQLIEQARSAPGKYTYGSSGNGTPQHLAGSWLEKTTGAQFLHVPYKGGAPAVTGLLGGEIDFLAGSIAVLLPQIAAGLLRPLAVTSAKRWPTVPDVPAMLELGVQDFDLYIWLGLWLPAGVPRDKLAELFAMFHTAIEAQTVQEILKREGLTPMPSDSPEEFAAFAASEYALWGKIVKSSGARIE